MSYGLKQSQIIVKPLADATKGAIELNRDVTGNPTNNVILTDIYLGDNEHMIYDPATGHVCGTVSHFKTGFVNGELTSPTTSNSEYALVAATLLDGVTASTFTPSYFQVGHFAVSAATITDFNGGTLILNAGESLGHIDLHDNMIVMHPQPASIASNTKKDMGFVFSRSSDTASMLFLDATDGEFYLKTVTHAGGLDIDVHNLGATSGTLTLATLNVGALNIGGTLVPTSYALGDLSNVTLGTLVSGQVLKYDGSTWYNGTDESGAALAGLTDVNLGTYADGQFLQYDLGTTSWINIADVKVARPSYDAWVYNHGANAFQGSGDLGAVTGDTLTLSAPASHIMESIVLVGNSHTTGSNVILPSIGDLVGISSSGGFKMTIKNTGTQVITITRGNTDLIDGETSIELPLQYSSVTLTTDGLNKWYII